MNRRPHTAGAAMLPRSDVLEVDDRACDAPRLPYAPPGTCLLRTADLGVLRRRKYLRDRPLSLRAHDAREDPAAGDVQLAVRGLRSCPQREHRAEDQQSPSSMDVHRAHSSVSERAGGERRRLNVRSKGGSIASGAAWGSTRRSARSDRAPRSRSGGATGDRRRPPSGRRPSRR